MLDLKYRPSNTFVQEIHSEFDVFIPASITMTVIHSNLRIGDENVASTHGDPERIESEVESSIRNLFKQKKRYDSIFKLLIS